VWNRGILAARPNRSSESSIEGASTQCNGADFLPFAAKKNLRASVLNRASTIDQQLFNSGVLDAPESRLYAVQNRR
jgi:hypothetical protein